MDKLGIDIRLIASQVINFFILLFLLKKLVYKPLLGLFENRKKLVEKTYENFDEVKKKVEESSAEAQKILKKAKADGQEIIKDNQRQGQQEVKEMLDKAGETTKKMLSAIEVDKASLVAEVAREVEKRTAAIVAQATKSVLSDMDESTQHEVIKKVIAKLPSKI